MGLDRWTDATSRRCIDLFVWTHDAPTLARELERAGYREFEGPPSEAQRDFRKEGEELQVTLLDRNEHGEVIVAAGPWARAAWPAGMLEGPPGRIDRIICPIVHPRVQIEIKERFPEWLPDLPPRDKHVADLARLRQALLLQDR